MVFVMLWALLSASLANASDGTVGKQVVETFEMYNADGTPRPDCDPSLFSVTAKKDNETVSLSATFRNYSTGSYTMNWTPAATGEYSGDISYDGDRKYAWYKHVLNYDADTIASAIATHDTDVKALLDNFGLFAGTGDTAVTEDTGGDCHLCWKTSGGAGIADAVVYAYVEEDWDAGLRTDAYVRGWTRTDDSGGFQWPLRLNSGITYKLIYKKAGYKTDSEEVTP